MHSAIINVKKLAKTPLRQKALLIAEAGYEAIGIERAIRDRLKLRQGILRIQRLSPLGDKTVSDVAELNLHKFHRVFVVGIGKGSALALLEIARILEKKMTKGIALDVLKPKFTIGDRLRRLPGRMDSFIGTHPLPSELNVRATQRIIKLAEDLEEKDLLIFFICGGGSALACSSEYELKESSLVFDSLTKAGADIIELNIVRKHLSKFKGGGLAKIASRGTITSLIVSDVLGNDLSVIASGPTVFDSTTKTDAENILKKYGLNPNDFHLIETPKDENLFKKIQNILLISNQDAVHAMLAKARELGFHAGIYSTELQGEAKDIFLPMVRHVESNEAILAAGETTVTLASHDPQVTSHKLGKGGRNMEAVLSALAQLTTDHSQLTTNTLFISIASDGHDNTEAAGAIGDYKTVEAAYKHGLDYREYLASHDSFHFFEKTGDLIFVKPKSFNVADLMLVLKE